MLLIWALYILKLTLSALRKNSKLIRSQVVHIIIISGFVYQIYDQTVNYLEYDVNTDLKFDRNSGDYTLNASITVCFHTEYSVLKNKTLPIFIIKQVVCQFDRIWCNMSSPINYHYKPNGKICLTFLNTYITNTSVKIDYNTGSCINLKNMNKAHVTVNPIYHPAHFRKMLMVFKYFTWHIIHIDVTLQRLLPRPYRTDCYDYESNRMPGRGGY